MIRPIVLTGLCICASLSSALAAPVSQVEVHLTSSGAAMPGLVQKRIAASIQTVGNHVLLDHDDDDIAAQKDGYIRIVNDVVNRVLIGYTVDSIDLRPGPVTAMDVHIRPWGDTIETVRVDVNCDALPELAQQMVRKDIAGSEERVRTMVVGLPVDALDWANGAVQSVLESEFEAMLPEFYPHFVITAGKETDVQIYLLPKLPVVRNATVSIEAENLPKVIFLSTRKNLETRYAGLDGLPVSFVRRHENDLCRDVQEMLAQQWVIDKYKLNVTPTVKIGENLDIHLLSQTDFYDIGAGAYIDVGRDDDEGHGRDTVIRGHLGRKIGKHHEVFSAVEFMPGAVDWNFIPGYFYKWGNHARLGYDYETDDNSNHLWFYQDWGTRWGLRLDRDLTHENTEVGVSYRYDDYLGFEYVVSDHDHWLRVIGYL